jgi:hypothetical protein
MFLIYAAIGIWKRPGHIATYTDWTSCKMVISSYRIISGKSIIFRNCFVPCGTILANNYFISGSGIFIINSIILYGSSIQLVQELITYSSPLASMSCRKICLFLPGLATLEIMTAASIAEMFFWLKWPHVSLKNVAGLPMKI